MRKVRSLRQQAGKLKNIGINAGFDLLLTKPRQLTARADRLEEEARPAHHEHSAGAIRLSNSGSHAKALVTINETTVISLVTRPAQRRELAEKAVATKGVSIALACRTFGSARPAFATARGAMPRMSSSPTFWKGWTSTSLNHRGGARDRNRLAMDLQQ